MFNFYFKSYTIYADYQMKIYSEDFFVNEKNILRDDNRNTDGLIGNISSLKIEPRSDDEIIACTFYEEKNYTGNSFKLSLYTNSAVLGKSTTSFTTDAQVSNSGQYTSGGGALVNGGTSLSSNHLTVAFNVLPERPDNTQILKLKLNNLAILITGWFGKSKLILNK